MNAIAFVVWIFVLLAALAGVIALYRLSMQMPPRVKKVDIDLSEDPIAVCKAMRFEP